VLPPQTIREQAERLRADYRERGTEAPLDRVLALDEERRTLLGAVESMRAERNRAGKAIGAARDAEERARLIEEQRAGASALDAQEARLRDAEAELARLSLELPNLLDERVQPGGDDEALVVREADGAGAPERALDQPMTRGDAADPPTAEPAPPPHWDIGEALGIIDFERGVKLAGPHFYVLCDEGARLQRALITWMLDLHRSRGYREVYTPFVVREEMLYGTGQLPKFADTMYHDSEDDLWMVPTAEVPVTNLYRDEILAADALPIHHSAYTPCFRRERFSPGRSRRGLKRGHQFDKVELVRFVEPERSWEALEQLLDDAIAVVRALGLRYRVLRLAAGDVSFAGALTYDIEVWAPGSREWLEVSSATNFLDFQARRASIRYRDAEGQVRHLHTLNASGLALPRTLAALLERGWRADGSVELPDVLHPYLGGLTRLPPA
jgi:seryl-tRNA synthetase